VLQFLCASFRRTRAQTHASEGAPLATCESITMRCSGARRSATSALICERSFSAVCLRPGRRFARMSRAHSSFDLTWSDGRRGASGPSRARSSVCPTSLASFIAVFTDSVVLISSNSAHTHTPTQREREREADQERAIRRPS
jgi:hypothetical protein